MKRRGLVLSAVLAGALMTTACAAQTGTGTAAAGDAQQKVVNVTASETVTAEPDIAEFEMTVYSQATDAKTCQTQNSTDLEKAVEALKSQGIAETSIQTASFGLNPIYDWEAGKTITGYEMETRLTVKDVPIEKAGDVLSTVVDAGVNRIDSVSYLCSSFDEKYEEALKLAIENGKKKAASMAEAGGCSIGQTISISELSSDQSARYTEPKAIALETASADIAAGMGANVMGGEIEIEASVSIDFAIK